MQAARGTDTDGRRATRALSKLFHHRWTVPVLAQASRFDETVGGVRDAMLRGALGVSRPSLDRTLAHVRDERRWLVKHKGYGHPLRPELVLTTNSRPLATWCGTYAAVVERLDVDDVAYRKWTAAVIEAVRVVGNRARFSEIEAVLTEVSPRALALSLKDLVAADLLRRDVDDGFPPAVRYALTRTGRRIASVTKRLPNVP